jgi:hypothetical protein
MRHRFALLTVILLLLPAGCSTGPVNGPEPAAPPARSMTPSPTSSVVGDPAQCPAAEEVLPLVDKAIERAAGVGIGEIRMTHCRDGYARALLIPSPPGAADDLPIFFKKSDSGWQIVAFGGDIVCSYEQGLEPATLAACRALGVK